MPSRVVPLENLKQRSVMFWLPPGGRDNGVWADTWVILADLEPADVAPVLARLRRADIGGYAATPAGRRGAAHPGKQLYVDREQHSRATDVVMTFLRDKDQPPAAFTARRRAATEAPPRPHHRAIVTAAKVVSGAALIGLGLLFAYYAGAQYLANTHRAPPPAPVSGVPGITNVRP